MGVQLNIKDPETVRLARELADQRGVSITQIIRDALEEDARRRETDIQQRIIDVKALTANGREYLEPEWRDKSLKEIMDSIYDEDGSPA